MKKARNDKNVKLLMEAHKTIYDAKDCIEGIASESGYEELNRYAKGGAKIIDRLERALILVKGVAADLAGGKGNAAKGYWELMIRNTYVSDEAPTTIACRTVEAAREQMEKDIRETMATHSPKYEPEDIKRINENTVQLGDEVVYEIEWKALVG